MKDLLLDDALSPVASSLELIKASVKRRHFMQTLGLVAAGLALYPKIAVAEPAEAGQWRDTVTKFVEKICNDDNRQAQTINTQIYQSSVNYAPAPTTFHATYSAPLIFATRVLPQRVVCSNGFQVYWFPAYDIYHPCRGLNDLNAFEMRRITNQKEVAQYGCVVAPTNSRGAIEYGDHADYNQTVASYGINPRDFKPEFKRVFTGKGRSRFGYQVVHKSQVGLSGKPLRDVLLSDRDW